MKKRELRGPSSFFMTTVQLTQYLNRYILWAITIFIVVVLLFTNI